MINNATTSKQMLREFFMDSLTSLEIPELTRLSSKQIVYNELVINNENLQTINFPNLEQQPGIIAGNDLRTINIPSLIVVNNNANIISRGGLRINLLERTKIQSLNLPNLQGTTTEETDLSNLTHPGFGYNYWLKSVSLGNPYLAQDTTLNAAFGNLWFYNNYSLQELILNYPYLIPLNGSTGLSTTPIFSGRGFIYVPDGLVNNYKIANRWSSFSSQIRPLSKLNHLDSEDKAALGEDTISYSWSEIIERCGTDSMHNDLDEYLSVGNTKTVMINGVPTQFVIVAQGRDPLPDGGYASLTWMENSLQRFYKINTSVDSSLLYNYSNCTSIKEELTKLYNGFESTVKNNIKTVVKNSYGKISPINYGDVTTEETLWIPSARELALGGAMMESDGSYTHYSGANSGANKVFKLGKTNFTDATTDIALRTFTSDYNFPAAINSNAQLVESSYSTNPNRYLIIGFCT